LTNASGNDNRALTIVAFGDSTTAPRSDIFRVYPVRLEKTLTTLGFTARLINAGIPGSHTGSVKDNSFYDVLHGMDRFQKSVLDLQPDWVIIFFGINDSWQYNSRQEPSVIPLEQYSNNIVYFIEEIQKSNGKTILVTPNPIGKQYEKWRSDKLETYRKEIKRLGKIKNLPVVDTWDLFCGLITDDANDIDSFLLDGMHPNDNGHKLISEALSGIILDSQLHQQRQNNRQTGKRAE
jgi:lysophospholipase L1-like esterase